MLIVDLKPKSFPFSMLIVILLVSFSYGFLNCSVINTALIMVSGLPLHNRNDVGLCSIVISLAEIEGCIG